MATTKKKAAPVPKPKAIPNDTFIIIPKGDDCLVAEGVSEEAVTKELLQMVADDANDRYYEDNVYSIYKLVKRVRVNIEHPLPVVKLIPVKD